jgi:hypothetical protein
MYKTAIEYYQEPVERYIKYSNYEGPSNNLYSQINEKFIQQEKLEPSVRNNQPVTNMKWKTEYYTNTSDPSVWGQAFWFTLHNGASKYPISAAPLVKNRMKAYILGIPYMLPCSVCKEHAIRYIEEINDNLDDMCSGREKLFSFFVDFHNDVNKRYNKPIVSVKEAYKIYNEGIDVNILSYK